MVYTVFYRTNPIKLWGMLKQMSEEFTLGPFAHKNSIFCLPCQIYLQQDRLQTRYIKYKEDVFDTWLPLIVSERCR